MAITFTPTSANEHENGARLGTLSNDVNDNYFFYWGKPDYLKIIGNELFLEDGWHFNFEDQTLYKYTISNDGSLTWSYLQPNDPFRVAIKDLDADQGFNWSYATPEFSDVSESISVTPVPFGSLESGVVVATLLSTLNTTDKFILGSNSFLEIDGNNIKLLDNFYYDMESGKLNNNEGYFWDPTATSGSIAVSSIQIDAGTSAETANYYQSFDYPTFLQTILSQVQEPSSSSSLTFTAVTANEHENGAVLGAFQTTAEAGGVYSFDTSKPSMLKIEGNQLMLEAGWHFDYETRQFFNYSGDGSSGVQYSYVGPYELDQLTWRIKYTPPNSGTQQLVDATISFADITEAIEITPVPFNSLEAGATVATISTTISNSEKLNIVDNNFVLLDGTDVKLKSNMYYNIETGKFHSGSTFYDPASSYGQISLSSVRADSSTGIETIDFTQAFDYPTFLTNIASQAQHSALTYYGSRGVETKSKNGENRIDALLYDDVKVHSSDEFYENSLNGLAQNATVITYSFPGSDGVTPTFFDGNEESTAPAQVYALTSEQRDAARLALAEFEKVANIKFHEVQETGNQVGTIRFAFTDYSSADTNGFWGWASAPYESAASGDIWIHYDQYNDTDWQQGTSYNFMSLMHEIGHTLGLAHPFAEDGSGSSDVLPTVEDVRNYTIMSYTNPADNYYTYSDGGEYQYLISTTPMVYDIAAIQHLYGPAAYNTFDDTYTHDPAVPFVRTIWDSDGTDTLDGSNFSTDCIVSLVPGSYSTVPCNNWSMTDNFGIAYGAIIENAIGGTGNDTITGNDANNYISGGPGNDTLLGGIGDDELRGGNGTDILEGGSGNDQYRYDGTTGFDTIRETAGSLDDIYFETEYYSNSGWGSPYRDGNNLIYSSADGLSGFTVENHYSDPDKSIETFTFQYADYTLLLRNSDTPKDSETLGEMLVGTTEDDTLTSFGGFNAGTDEIYAFHGNDTIDASLGAKTWIEGGKGNDNITGSAFDDTIFGDAHIVTSVHNGPGNDAISGGAGNDKIYGGDGANILNGGVGNDTIEAGSGNDTITGGSGADTFKFSGNFGTDIVTDFSAGEDTLKFFDESSVEISISSLIESNNGDGDLVLAVAGGSSVTLQGVSELSQGSTLNGSVASRAGTAIEGATVRSLNGAGEELVSTTTDSSGNFNLNISGDVTLTIQKEFEDNGSITVWDALDALRLSVGLSKSDGTTDPLDFIAADMNQDGKVSVWDALEILRHSVGVDSSDPQWKFLSENFDGSSISADSTTFSEQLSVSFSEVSSNQNFVGILIGDVNIG